MTARGTIAAGAALAGLVAAAWAAVVWESRSMVPEPGIAAFLPSWTLMMAAMMLPSAAPFVLLYRKGGARLPFSCSTGKAGDSERSSSAYGMERGARAAAGHSWSSSSPRAGWG